MNIITVLKSSPTWTPEYVIKLKKAVDKNLKIDHNFYCITDVSEISGIKTLPMMGFPGSIFFNKEMKKLFE